MKHNLSLVPKSGTHNATTNTLTVDKSQNTDAIAITVSILTVPLTLLIVLLLATSSNLALIASSLLFTLFVLLINPRRAVIVACLLGCFLPFSAPAAVSLGFGKVAVADLLAALLAITLLMESRERGSPVRLSSNLWVVLPYFAAVSITLFFIGPNLTTLAELANRIWLTVPWLIAGYCAASRPSVIKSFVVTFIATSVVLAAVWLTQPGEPSLWGIQKNPAGGVFVIATILLLLQGRNLYSALALVPASGVLMTGSRGALISLAIAITVVVVLHPSAKNILVLLSVPAFALTAFIFMPTDMVDRLLSRNVSGAHNARLRIVFIEDALYQVQGAEVFGRGIGTYAHIDWRLQRVEAQDPHNVYALTFYEGGLVLLVGFLLMILISVLVAVLHFHMPSAQFFLVVFVALLAHSAVDIFWVRGKLGVAMAAWGVFAYMLRARTDQDVSSQGNGRPLGRSFKLDAPIGRFPPVVR